MKKLKIISQFNIIVFAIILITILYVIFNILNPPSSKYSKEETKITGIIYECKKTDEKTTIKIKGKENILINYYDNFNCRLGQKIIAKGEIKKPQKNTNFYLFNYKNYLLSQKINYIFQANKIEVINKNIPLKYQVKNALNKHIENYQSKPYLNALVLGNDDEINENIQNSYQTNGITHLLAISGAQITLFSSILLFLFNKIFSKNTSYLITIIFLLI